MGVFQTVSQTFLISFRYKNQIVPIQRRAVKELEPSTSALDPKVKPSVPIELYKPPINKIIALPPRISFQVHKFKIYLKY